MAKKMSTQKVKNNFLIQIAKITDYFATLYDAPTMMLPDNAGSCR